MGMDRLLYEQIAEVCGYPEETKDDYLRRLENLASCFDMIRPKTHVEYAFCVWGQNFYDRDQSKVDLFCNRRNEGAYASQYSIVDSEKWGLPQTYDVFVFREQFNALFAELMGLSQFWQGPLVFKDFIRGEMTFDRFSDLLEPKFSGMTITDKKEIFEKINNDCKSATPYYYCSSVVDRASVLSSGDVYEY